MLLGIGEIIALQTTINFIVSGIFLFSPLDNYSLRVPVIATDISFMSKLFWCFIFSVLVTVSLWGQSPKREFRGAWIASVANIDWPSKPGLPVADQEREFVQRLDQLKALGFNAVIVQVRPAADALYASKIEPWSHYLVGPDGAPADPSYDPLVFMVEEAHKRNMEFHAWFNPFRALLDSRKNPNPAGHVTRTHPGWIINYGGKAYIDPGVPEARDYVIRVITDVVKRYDIDAVHLDDYFYPYRVAGEAFGDGKSYARYGNGGDREDWRRGNVNDFIYHLNLSIKSVKPYMKLGISPFGIWRNKTKDPNGSDTKGGQTDYDDLYADVMLWMEKGWIDYLLPQLYWEHASHAAPFGVLLPWWYGHCFKRQVYYGLGLYRMADARSGPWAKVDELLWQLRDIRGQCPNTGFAVFSASSFDKMGPAIQDSMKLGYDRYPALIPPMPWLDSVAPAAPALTVTSNKMGAAQLRWTIKNSQNERLKYVVYRFVNNEPVDLERSDRILTLTQATEFTDLHAGQVNKPVYIVTALDRMWNESKGSNKVALKP